MFRSTPVRDQLQCLVVHTHTPHDLCLRDRVRHRRPVALGLTAQPQESCLSRREVTFHEEGRSLAKSVSHLCGTNERRGGEGKRNTGVTASEPDGWDVTPYAAAEGKICEAVGRVRLREGLGFRWGRTPFLELLMPCEVSTRSIPSLAVAMGGEEDRMLPDGSECARVHTTR